MSAHRDTGLARWAGLAANCGFGADALAFAIAGEDDAPPGSHPRADTTACADPNFESDASDGSLDRARRQLLQRLRRPLLSGR